MSVPATESVGTPYFSLPAAGTATDPGSTADKDMFLKLMVTQLKNQDPMNPTDSSQFLAQTAQFTSLEKLTDLATQSTQALSAQLAFGASALIGRTVTYTDSTGAEQTGAVDTVRFTPNGPVLRIDGSDVDLASVTGTTTTDPTGAAPDATS